MSTQPKTISLEFPMPKRWLGGTLVLCGVVLVLWAFPRLWYTRSDSKGNVVWLAEQKAISGWTNKALSVTQVAERLLAADVSVNGEFARAQDHAVVRVFSAKRYSEKPHDIGLFVHTPDRCWTEGGWALEPIAPDHVEVDVHGVHLVLERRLFVHGLERELVYFGGLVGGQPLPYRLDHNLSVGMKHALKAAGDSTGTTLRAADERFWQRVWDSFASRRQLLGPKQFIRLSTPAAGGNLAQRDRLLTDFLAEWLLPVDYQAELKAWQAQRK